MAGQLFYSVNLADPLAVSSTLERRVEEFADDVAGARFRDESSAEGQHVEVVVLARQSRRLGIHDRRGADAAHFVGGDRHTDAAAADENTAIEIARRDAARDDLRIVRIVDRR